MTPEYLAGLFDGEGCVYCAEALQHGHPAVITQLEIANTHKGIIDMLHQDHGGSCSRQRPGRLGKHEVWIWRVDGLVAERFARLITPHAILKRHQLDLFLELRSTIIRAGGRTPVPESTWDRRRQIIKDIRDAKRAHLVVYEVLQ